METVADLEAQLTRLRTNRSLGTKSMSHNGKETVFMSDAELASAIADVERRLNTIRGGRISTIRLHSSKGF